MSKGFKISKKNRVIRRILENTEIYTERELSNMSTQELFHMQEMLLIKLMIKIKFNSRIDKRRSVSAN